MYKYYILTILTLYRSIILNIHNMLLLYLIPVQAIDGVQVIKKL